MTDEKKPARRLTDEEAMDRIQAALSGEEWDAVSLQEILVLVRLTGRAVNDLRQDKVAEVGE